MLNPTSLHTIGIEVKHLCRAESVWGRTAYAMLLSPASVRQRSEDFTKAEASSAHTHHFTSGMIIATLHLKTPALEMMP